ncbi:HHIP-like protein 1 [Dermochelys coriacea]|uniref:HHIP-like protein 1 n=1 Tax=Dermochelys coriacea TaxID=27794 RepID=UPI001CA8BD7E|nr:HHIP-like protein 1 [Dermochelys coriacea]
MGPGATALGALLLLLGQDPWVLPHPQCLDYKPPFQPPQPLAFCPEYSAFGCCNGRRDAQLSARFQVLGTFLDPAGLQSCGHFLRDLLCQVSGGATGQAARLGAGVGGHRQLQEGCRAGGIAGQWDGGVKGTQPLSRFTPMYR